MRAPIASATRSSTADGRNHRELVVLAHRRRVLARAIDVGLIEGEQGGEQHGLELWELFQERGARVGDGGAAVGVGDEVDDDRGRVDELARSSEHEDGEASHGVRERWEGLSAREGARATREGRTKTTASEGTESTTLRVNTNVILVLASAHLQ